MITPHSIVSYTLSCACGVGLDAIKSSVLQRTKTLAPARHRNLDLETWVGTVPGADAHPLPQESLVFNSRNNRLLNYALDQDDFSHTVRMIVERLGSTRVAVIMGSSTASMAESEEVYSTSLSAVTHKLAKTQTSVHHPHAPGRFVAHKLGISGPAVTISTACSSSAKAFAMASRWLQAELVDAVVVGGSDSLSLGTLYGFSSLNLLSKNPCRPFDQRRDGISVGEAAGFALLTRANISIGVQPTGLTIAGIGESSDAHHMSHPHPEGAGAVAAMTEALRTSQCSPADIGYINLHGTATTTNDTIESHALSNIFGDNTRASSTKGWTGHTLGAAGITGAVFALEALRTDVIPGTLNLEEPDESLKFPVMKSNQEVRIEHAMINAFGFGGSNCSLVFGRSYE